MGFVAILGVISLIGMVIRNSVILIVQIDEHIAAGEHPWSAVISATEHRLRPILLTAAAAILGMIPIAPTVFWGPMAFAVMGGLVVATLLTLVFLPALYVTWFRITPPDKQAEAARPNRARQRPRGQLRHCFNRDFLLCILLPHGHMVAGFRRKEGSRTLTARDGSGPIS